jgi:hypothetical protein
VDVPGRLGWWDQESAPAVPAERIGFLSIPQGPPEEGRSGGDGRPLVESPRPAPAPPPLVAPREVPTGVPAAPATPAPAEEPTGGSGEVIGEGGPTAGIRPSMSTPRLYAPPEDRVFVAPRASKPGKPTAAEIDREVRRRLGGINDSLAALPPQRAPGDWTVEKGGQKWGIDQKKIYLGPVSLPTALLALLPLNVQGNPTEIERGRALSYQRQDIQYHAQRAASDEEFKAAVKRIRERKERERRAAQEGVAEETENAPVP